MSADTMEPGDELLPPEQTANPRLVDDVTYILEDLQAMSRVLWLAALGQDDGGSPIEDKVLARYADIMEKRATDAHQRVTKWHAAKREMRVALK